MRSTNAPLNPWVDEVARQCKPANIRWRDCTKKEYDTLMAGIVNSGLATPLAKRTNSFLFRAQPPDVAPVEGRTYVSYPSKGEAGPGNI